MAPSTTRRVSGRTAGSSLITRDTVAMETSARRATSWMVVIDSPTGDRCRRAAGTQPPPEVPIRYGGGRRLDRFSTRQYGAGREGISSGASSAGVAGSGHRPSTVHHNAVVDRPLAIQPEQLDAGPSATLVPQAHALAV